MSIDGPSCCPSDFINGLNTKIREINQFYGLFKIDLTFSTSTSGISLTASVEEKVKWFMLMRGKIRCFDMISEERLYPEKHVSHLHLNDSHSNVNARSYASGRKKKNMRVACRAIRAAVRTE